MRISSRGLLVILKQFEEEQIKMKKSKYTNEQKRIDEALERGVQADKHRQIYEDLFDPNEEEQDK